MWKGQGQSTLYIYIKLLLEGFATLFTHSEFFEHGWVICCSPLGALFANGTASKPLCNREWSLAPQTFACVCFSSAPFFGLIEPGAASFCIIVIWRQTHLLRSQTWSLMLPPGTNLPPPLRHLLCWVCLFVRVPFCWLV